MQEINTWLQGDRNYDYGVQLYKLYGKNSFLKGVFAKGETPFNTSKLFSELHELAPALCIALPEKEPITAPETTPLPLPKSDFHRQYLSLLKTRDTIVLQIDRNMAALNHSQDKAVLFDTAKQILRLDQKKREIWAKLDYYQEHGTFELEQEPVTVPLEKQKQLIYQSICKARKRLEDPNCKYREKTEKLIATKIAELESLKSQ